MDAKGDCNYRKYKKELQNFFSHQRNQSVASHTGDNDDDDDDDGGGGGGGGGGGDDDPMSDYNL